MTAVRVLISGGVQGVGFRWSVERVARRTAVAGWVRNLADGRVEAWFEGPAEAVEEVVAYCRRGPDAASVNDLSVSVQESQGLEGFRIR